MRPRSVSYIVQETRFVVASSRFGRTGGDVALEAEVEKSPGTTPQDWIFSSVRTIRD